MILQQVWAKNFFFLPIAKGSVPCPTHLEVIFPHLLGQWGTIFSKKKFDKEFFFRKLFRIAKNWFSSNLRGSGGECPTPWATARVALSAPYPLKMQENRFLVFLNNFRIKILDRKKNFFFRFAPSASPRHF